MKALRQKKAIPRKNRRLALLVTVILVPIVVATGVILKTAGNDNALLQGVWAAESMEADGTPAPSNAVAQMQFTFIEDKLVIRGNFSDAHEDECDYKIDPKQSPKHIDIVLPKLKDPVVGIYEVTARQLWVCLRQDDAKLGVRPTEFAAKAGSKHVLIVFKKQNQ